MMKKNVIFHVYHSKITYSTEYTSIINNSLLSWIIQYYYSLIGETIIINPAQLSDPFLLHFLFYIYLTFVFHH